MFQDQFQRLVNEYPKIEKLIEEMTRIKAEMTIVKTRFNMLSAEEMEVEMDKYDRLYSKIPEIVEKIDIYQSKIYSLAVKLDTQDFDGYDKKEHKSTIKTMKKQIKESYKNQIDEDVEYEEDIQAQIGEINVNEKEDKKTIFNTIKRKINKK